MPVFFSEVSIVGNENIEKSAPAANPSLARQRAVPDDRGMVYKSMMARTLRHSAIGIVQRGIRGAAAGPAQDPGAGARL